MAALAVQISFGNANLINPMASPWRNDPQIAPLIQSEWDRNFIDKVEYYNWLKEQFAHAPIAPGSLLLDYVRNRIETFLGPQQAQAAATSAAATTSAAGRPVQQPIQQVQQQQPRPQQPTQPQQQRQEAPAPPQPQFQPQTQPTPQQVQQQHPPPRQQPSQQPAPQQPVRSGQHDDASVLGFNGVNRSYYRHVTGQDVQPAPIQSDFLNNGLDDPTAQQTFDEYAFTSIEDPSSYTASFTDLGQNGESSWIDPQPPSSYQSSVRQQQQQQPLQAMSVRHDSRPPASTHQQFPQAAAVSQQQAAYTQAMAIDPSLTVNFPNQSAVGAFQHGVAVSSPYHQPSQQQQQHGFFPHQAQSVQPSSLYTMSQSPPSMTSNQQSYTQSQTLGQPQQPQPQQQQPRPVQRQSSLTVNTAALKAPSPQPQPQSGTPSSTGSLQASTSKREPSPAVKAEREKERPKIWADIAREARQQLDTSRMQRAPIATAKKLSSLLASLNGESTNPNTGDLSAVPAEARLELLTAMKKANKDFFASWVSQSGGRDVLKVWLKGAADQKGKAAKDKSGPSVDAKVITSTLSTLLEIIDKLPLTIEHLRPNDTTKAGKISLGRVVSKIAGEKTFPPDTRNIASRLESRWRLMANSETGKVEKRKADPADEDNRKKRKISPPTSTETTSKPAAKEVKPEIAFKAASKLPAFAKRKPLPETAKAPSPVTHTPSTEDPFKQAMSLLGKKASDIVPTTTAPGRPAQKKKKSVTFAQGALLEQIKLIEPISYDDEDDHASYYFFTSARNIRTDTYSPQFSHPVGDARQMDINEGLSFQGVSDLEEELEWYTPPDLEYPTDLSPVESEEAAVQEEREKSVLTITYFDVSEIPDSPSEPLNTDDSMAEDVKVMPLGPELKDDGEFLAMMTAAQAQGASPLVAGEQITNILSQLATPGGTSVLSSLLAQINGSTATSTPAAAISSNASFAPPVSSVSSVNSEPLGERGFMSGWDRKRAHIPEDNEPAREMRDSRDTRSRGGRGRGAKNRQRVVCKFHPHCTYGDTCHFLHVDP